MTDRPFRTEADLCSAFLLWVGKHAGVKAFAEWAGWDILLAYADGRQVGIQAKLRLGADVIEQAAPHAWGYWRDDERPAPDYRAVLVPERVNRTWAAIADRLGLVLFQPGYRGFTPALAPHTDWIDWNPARRHELPPVATDSIAGSPCPVTLTDWKLAALDVLAELATKGTITTKRIRELGVHPGRWTTARWLQPAETRGLWIRAARCPKFDEQHPTAYAVALAKAREGAA